MKKKNSDEKLTSSKKGDYYIDNIVRLMTEEEHGLHISLIDSGDMQGNLPRMNIVVETDLNGATVRNIMEGLLKRYEEETDND